jgi:hypothetical protein
MKKLFTKLRTLPIFFQVALGVLLAFYIVRVEHHWENIDQLSWQEISSIFDIKVSRVLSDPPAYEEIWDNEEHTKNPDRNFDASDEYKKRHLETECGQISTATLMEYEICSDLNNSRFYIFLYSISLDDFNYRLAHLKRKTNLSVDYNSNGIEELVGNVLYLTGITNNW